MQLVAPIPVGRILDTYSVAALFQNQDQLYGDYAATKEALADLGVKHIRGRFVPGSDALISNWQDLAETLGIRVLCRFGAIEIPDSMQDTPKQLVQKLIDNFGATAVKPDRNLLDYVCAIEGLNEPNNDGIPWITRSVAYTKATYEAWYGNLQTRKRVKLTGPALARVNLGGAEGDNLATQAANFAAAAEAIHGKTGQGLRPWVTHGVTHIYPLGRTPSTDYNTFTDVMRATIYPQPLKMMTTEGGYFGDMSYRGRSNVTPEDVSAIYDDKHIMEHVIRESRYFSRHEIWDTKTRSGATSTEQRENSFGLIRADRTRKPGFDTIKNFLALVTDLKKNGTPKTSIAITPLPISVSPPPAAPGGTSKLRFCLAQHSDGSYRAIIWRDEDVRWSSTDPYRISPKTPTMVTVTLGEAHRVTEYQPSLQAGPTVPAESKAEHTIALKDNLVVLKIA